MASMFARDRGYDEELFELPVSDNFKCSICLNVLKNPKSCGRNQHYFCFGCIGQHLENSHTCPECMEVLTPETLMQPPRLLLNCISELRIKCGFNERGCPEFVQLARLQNHEDECEYGPATCGNEGCGAEINKRDKLHHETELCEFRKVECDGCAELKKEMKKVKENMEKQIEKLKQDQVQSNKDAEERIGKLKRDQETAERNAKELDGKMAALVERMKEGVKDMLVGNLDAKVESIFNDPQSSQNTQGSNQQHGPPISHDVIIMGGCSFDEKITNSVEKFCCKEGKWIELAPMIVPRSDASSVVFENQVIVSGGNIPSEKDPVPTDSIEILHLDQLSATWVMSDAKLPVPMSEHQTFVYKGRLILVRFCENKSENFVCQLFEMSLIPPYAKKQLCILPYTRTLFHNTPYKAELLDDKLFIFGGQPPDYDSIFFYDLVKKDCWNMPRLPFTRSGQAMVPIGKKIMVLGGGRFFREGRMSTHKVINDVQMYDTETGESVELPGMIHERKYLSAVLVDGVVIVMGGYYNSVEFYDFRSNAWQAARAMKKMRTKATAVVSPL
ncbi:uncharacterized protein LOC114539801 [Dendronephthya gigantea]|uniref:uncharacterized protein LOC114539801 n=1 Tax=Dendronephthya gigantea TaxID=151771 RepID=UPI0010694A49|nr:uncharacterized protein LOC114539801 [Dendronephthya gigantea]